MTLCRVYDTLLAPGDTNCGANGTLARSSTPKVATEKANLAKAKLTSVYKAAGPKVRARRWVRELPVVIENRILSDLVQLRAFWKSELFR